MTRSGSQSAVRPIPTARTLRRRQRTVLLEPGQAAVRKRALLVFRKSALRQTATRPTGHVQPPGLARPPRPAHYVRAEQTPALDRTGSRSTSDGSTGRRAESARCSTTARPVPAGPQSPSTTDAEHARGQLPRPTIGRVALATPDATARAPVRRRRACARAPGTRRRLDAERRLELAIERRVRQRVVVVCAIHDNASFNCCRAAKQPRLDRSLRQIEQRGDLLDVVPLMPARTMTMRSFSERLSIARQRCSARSRASCGSTSTASGRRRWSSARHAAAVRRAADRAPSATSCARARPGTARGRAAG